MLTNISALTKTLSTGSRQHLLFSQVMNPDLSNLVRIQVLKNRKIWKKETKELDLAFVSPESVYQATVPVEAIRFAKNNNK